MSADPSKSLLNAMDGVARYEAREELKRRDPDVVIPQLKAFLDGGHARYAHEVMDLLGVIGGRAEVESFLDHPDRKLRTVAARALRNMDKAAPPPSDEA